MPQIQTNTSTPLGYSTSSLAAQLQTLISTMRAGQSITASDMQSLISAYNLFVGHYHSVHDLVGRDTYGNVGVYGAGGAYSDHNTSASTNYSPLSLPAVASGSEITAATINQMVAAVNSVRSHSHPILNQLQAAFPIPLDASWTTAMGSQWYSNVSTFVNQASPPFPTYQMRLTLGAATSVQLHGAADDGLSSVTVNGVSAGIPLTITRLSVSTTNPFTIPAGFSILQVVCTNDNPSVSAIALQLINASTGVVMADINNWFIAPL